MGTHPIFESDFDCLTVNHFRMENEIFVIQQHRIEQHKEFEEAFKISQCNFTEYRTQLDKITKSMQSLSQRAVEARNALVKDGKDELANIIIEIQKNEEELLIVSAAHQVSRSQSNDDEEDLRNHKRSLRNKISELLEDYKAEMD